MFERIGLLAEKTAEGLSRRSFLTRMGMGALALATFASRGWADGPNCVLNGCKCRGTTPYYNNLTNQCCSDKRCTNCTVPCFQCVQNGGCCSGLNPYQKLYFDGTQVCCRDAACGTCGVCSSSNCCGSTTSGNSCWGGLCYSDSMCNNRC
jgi:hypothetical protein